jgi:cell division protease FtsH
MDFRFFRSRPGRRWLWALAPVVIVLVGALVWLTRKPSTALSYGEFRAQLAAGHVKSVRVGRTELSGILDRGGREAAFRSSRLGMEHDDELVPLLARHVPGGRYEAEPDPTVSETVIVTGLTLIGLASIVWIIYNRGGLGSAMAFARSRHKSYDGGESRVSFDDVAGIDEAVVELREVVDFLRTPERFRMLGGRVPKGILLVGPPGTGKTLLARAVAGESGVPFFSLSGSDFMEMYVGVGAARVRNLFAEAEAAAPCLIFIDEIDAIGKARSSGGGGGTEERDQTLNQLLVCMDGFDVNSGVIVLAASNRPETLDPALVRPGRFDRNVTVDRPDVAGRERILQVHVRKVPVAEGLDLRQIAAMTSGFVGADLANLVNEAALLAARRGKTIVEHTEFEESVERILAGPRRTQRLVRSEDRRRIAVHEAGHALVACSLPDTDPVHKLTIVGRGLSALGYTLYRPGEDRVLHTRTWLNNYIAVLLGGTVAEEVVYGEFSDGSTSDLQRATEVARKMVTEFGMSPKLGRIWLSAQAAPGEGMASLHGERTGREIDLEIRRILDEGLALAGRIVHERRPALDAISEALVERETLDSRDLQAILDRYPRDRADGTVRAG